MGIPRDPAPAPGIPGTLKRATAPAASDIAIPIAAPGPVRLVLTRERLSVFASLATLEQRPIEDVLAECMADTAARLLRTRPAFSFDAYDEAAFNEYLDSLERRQIEVEEKAARALTTPAMKWLAFHNDERERIPEPDLEEWNCSLPFGHTEAALAQD